MLSNPGWTCLGSTCLGYRLYSIPNYGCFDGDGTLRCLDLACILSFNTKFPIRPFMVISFFKVLIGDPKPGIEVDGH